MTNDVSMLDAVKTRRRVEDALRKSATPEQLVELAKVLKVEPAYLPEPPHCCCGHRDPARPYFGPDQVRCVHQLRKGFHYFDLYIAGKEFRREFIVEEEPYYRPEDKRWWVKVKYSGYVTIQNLSLSDHNIFPDEWGNWNASNWIAFSDESRPVGCGHHHHCCYSS